MFLIMSMIVRCASASAAQTGSGDNRQVFWGLGKQSFPHTSWRNLCLVAEHGRKTRHSGGVYVRQVAAAEAARRHKNHPGLSSCSLVKDSYAPDSGDVSKV